MTERAGCKVLFDLIKPDKRPDSPPDCDRILWKSGNCFSCRAAKKWARARVEERMSPGATIDEPLKIKDNGLQITSSKDGRPDAIATVVQGLTTTYIFKYDGSVAF